MNSDKTIISVPEKTRTTGETDHTVMFRPGVKITMANQDEMDLREFVFYHGVNVGRASDNDIVIANKIVSRHHLAIKYESQWCVYDLNSANGVYINDERIKVKMCLNLPARITLGTSGPSLELESFGQHDQAALGDFRRDEQSKISSPVTLSRTSNIDRNYSNEELKVRLLSKSNEDDFGHYTRMVRQIIHEDRIDQGKNYKKVIWLLSLLFLVSFILIAYQQISLSNARNLAIDMFYDIKTLEVSLSQAEIRLAESAEVLDLTMEAISSKKLDIDRKRIAAEQNKIQKERDLIIQKRKKLNEMKARYQQYVDEAKSFRLTFLNKTQYEDGLIFRVARGFGESELELPDGFIAEVKKYITYWQQSERLPQAMAHLEVHGYSSIIINALAKEDLPLYFAYLPLQESNYDTKAIGPETRFGIAKGAWQFLPATGQDYGLMPGPLANKRRYDEQDERFNFERATRAGAKHLKYLFSTEAQASGLLVLASYNYGHTRIKQILNQMPNNPREKNFWKFIQQSKLPKETYDYVLYIFSAAVIGEDPLHFGFGFKPFFN